MPLTWPRTTLISKLEKYRFEGGTHRCIRNWLHGHSQRVVINSSVFRKRPATSEVTQRSVLGPVLFSTFLNDMALDASSLQAVMARLDKALSSPIYWLATLSTTKGWNRMLFEVPSNLSYLLFYLLSTFTFIYSYKKLQASKTYVAFTMKSYSVCKVSLKTPIKYMPKNTQIQWQIKGINYILLVL